MEKELIPEFLYDLLKKQYGLCKIIDLRTRYEVNEKPDVTIDGVEYINIPVFDESVLGITREEKTDMQAMGLAEIPNMPDLYVRMVTDEDSVSPLSKIINIIADNEDGAVLWHCTEGKDRCGLVSALFLSMLGVDRDTILKDYLETNVSATKRAEGFYEAIVEKTGNVEKALEVKEAFLASEEYFNAAFDAILSKYSSVLEYIEKELKVERSKIERLRELCFK